jgi:Skp family chaperone for outer membrane proteins
MPDGNAAVLIVRVTDVLDNTKAGKKSADELKTRFLAAKKKREGIKDAVEATKFEIEFARELEGERARKRDELLTKARAAAEKIRAKKKAQLVVDAASVLAFAGAIDITDEIIAALDG